MFTTTTTPSTWPKLSLPKAGAFMAFCLITTTLFLLYRESQLHPPPPMELLDQKYLKTFEDQLAHAKDTQQDIISKIGHLGTADQLQQVLATQQALLEKLESMAQGEALQQDSLKKVDDLSAHLEEIKSLTQSNADALASSAAISASIEKSVQSAANRPIHLNEPAKTTPNCPIPADMDACVHHGANMTHIAELCGPITVLVGDCRDRVYKLTVTTKEFMAEVSDYTAEMMVVQGIDIGRELDSFVQTRSRWMVDTMGGNGFELLTLIADKERLALQKDLDRLQHRCANFFNGANHWGGFGSRWHNMGLGLAFSQYYNMTLYPVQKNPNFIPLTSCTEADMARAFSADPPQTDFGAWNTTTINFKSPNWDLGEMYNKNRMIIRPEYEHKGHFWWRSMLTYYAIRPNHAMRQLIRESSAVTTPCISIHVRHSDKKEEATLIDFSKYMEHADRYRAKTGVSNVYLMTDDDQVIRSAQDYSNFKFHYADTARSNNGWQADRDAGVTMEQMEETFLVDIFSAVRCQHSIVTYSSNVGRLIGEVAYAIRNTEPDIVSLDNEWMMNP
ncbi:hypothetical protein BGZ91_006489 [Linnemannia elongata]|nr:hypothetical protein BGZ91_006489 [Linnemannia elongata]